MSPLTIAELNLYPIKSFRAVPLHTALVKRMGFAYDRRWMLVDDRGRFLTQREHPTLATFGVGLGGDELQITAPDGSHLSIPLEAPRSPTLPVTIWNSHVKALTYAPEVDRFFSDVLATNVRLVRIPEAAVRDVDPRYGKTGDHVSFADGYPVLLTCTASLDDLNARLARPVPMNRFRPNIVVTSSISFEEEDWTAVDAPQARFRVVKPCGRCVITTTDQTTGERHAEPLRTLASYRTQGNSVNFGLNCIPEAEGSLTVGDRFTTH